MMKAYLLIAGLFLVGAMAESMAYPKNHPFVEERTELRQYSIMLQTMLQTIQENQMLEDELLQPQLQPPQEEEDEREDKYEVLPVF